MLIIKKITKYLILSVLFIFVWVSPVLAETLYAKKDGVKVTKEESPLSDVVAVIKKGEPVTVIEKKGRNYKVKLRDGKVGWVFKFKMSSKKPKSAKKGSSLLAGLTGESAISAKEARSGGSMRGLKEVSKKYAAHKKISPAHVKAVERMEKFAISEEEFIRFKKEGSIGEFSAGGQ